MDEESVNSSAELEIHLNKIQPNTVYYHAMKTLLLATACFLPILLMAQSPRVIMPQQPGPIIPQQQGQEEGLKENVTIRLQGTTTTGADIDLSLTGIGPRFNADQVVNADQVLTTEYLVTETEAGYRLSYTVSVRIKVPIQTNQANQTITNYEYRDVSTAGTVLCLAGRPVVLVRSGSKPLQVTISKEVEQDGGGKTAPSLESK